MARRAVACGDEGFLRRAGMGDQHVAIAALRIAERLAGADRHDADIEAERLGRDRQDMGIKPRVLRRGGGLDQNDGIVGKGRRGGKGQKGCTQDTHSNSFPVR